jgi:MraZ protein
MEESQSIERTYYTSRFRHGVDDKRRISIPARWRPAKAGILLTLVVWPKSKEGPCLRVLPPKKMESLTHDIEKMPNDDPDKPVLKRFVGSESTQVTLDKVGRICIPEEMAQAAGIEKEAILVGVLDAFEIWNPERYARVKNSDAIMAEKAFQRME